MQGQVQITNIRKGPSYEGLHSLRRWPTRLWTEL